MKKREGFTPHEILALRDVNAIPVALLTGYDGPYPSPIKRAEELCRRMEKDTRWLCGAMIVTWIIMAVLIWALASAHFFASPAFTETLLQYSPLLMLLVTIGLASILADYWPSRRIYRQFARESGQFGHDFYAIARAYIDCVGRVPTTANELELEAQLNLHAKGKVWESAEDFETAYPDDVRAQEMVRNAKDTFATLYRLFVRFGKIDAKDGWGPYVKRKARTD